MAKAIAYPNRERTLRHLEYKRAVYQYGRFPQRYVLPAATPEQIRQIQEAVRQMDTKMRLIALS
jgi:hypothetical protein